MNIYKSSILNITLVFYCFISFGQQRLNLLENQAYILYEYPVDNSDSIKNKDNARYVDSIMNLYFKVSLREYCWHFLNQNFPYTISFNQLDSVEFDGYMRLIKQRKPNSPMATTITNISMNTELVLRIDEDEDQYSTKIYLDGGPIFHPSSNYSTLRENLYRMPALCGYEIYIDKKYKSVQIYFISDIANQVKPKLQKMFDVKN